MCAPGSDVHIGNDEKTTVRVEDWPLPGLKTIAAGRFLIKACSSDKATIANPTNASAEAAIAMSRSKFGRRGRVLIDRTAAGHTIFIYPALGRDEATAEASRRIAAGDYRVASLLSIGDHISIRAFLIEAATAASTLEPNLAHALALTGGSAEVKLLTRHLKAALAIGVERRSEEQQLRVLSMAEALLKVRPSLLGARVLLEALHSPAVRTKPIAAKVISDYLLTGPPVPIDKCLAKLVPELLDSEDLCFVSAVPVLLCRQHSATVERCGRLLVSGEDNVRRALISNLIKCPYYGMELLLQALRLESQLDVKANVATALAPALSRRVLFGIAKDLLNATSPAVRMRATRLLPHLGDKRAHRLSERKDPDAQVDAELQSYRAPRSAGR